MIGESLAERAIHIKFGAIYGTLTIVDHHDNGRVEPAWERIAAFDQQRLQAEINLTAEIAVRLAPPCRSMEGKTHTADILLGLDDQAIFS